MAERPVSVLNPERENPRFGQDYRVVTWSNLQPSDTGEAFEFVQWADRSVQVAGDFGAGGAVVLEGTLDGVNYHTLTDAQGALLSFSAASRQLRLVSELPRWVRPRVTAGDGSTNLTVTLLVRRS